MPILNLGDHEAKKCHKYSVVGNYARRPFVKHAALLKDETPIRRGSQNIEVFHVAPPVVAGAQTIGAVHPRLREAANHIVVHLVGYVDLSQHDIEGVETWLAEVDKETRPPARFKEEIMSHYKVSPAVEWVEAENGTRLYRKFSCVGFVLACYRFIEIELIDSSDEAALPEVALDTLVEAYGPLVADPDLREKCGIPGPGPWRVMLPGYLFHALDRDSSVIRNTSYIIRDIGQAEFD